MAAPICVRFLLRIRNNSKCLPLFSRSISCRSCDKLNKEFKILSNYKCNVRKSRNSASLFYFDSAILGTKKCFTLEGQFRLEGKPWLKRSNASSDNSQFRDYTVQQNSDKKESLQKKEKENIYTIPNLLTLSRIVLTPAIGYFILHDSYSLALGLFAYAGFSDLLDGYIARNFKNQMSAFGTALDPLADKLMITVLTVTLTMSNLLPLPLAVLIIGRDVLLIMTGFVIRYVSLPPPKTLVRYFDITYPTAKLLPSKLSKWNTANQILLVMMTLAAPVFNFVDHPALQAMWYLTAITTFGSGMDYIINWRKCVKILK